MKITQQDLERWKENTLAVAKDLSLDENILTMLSDVPVEIIPGYSGFNFYGWSHYEIPNDYKTTRVEVYETNPSRYFPKALWEIWNQSGMDHELIGHIYNFHAGLEHNEPNARKTQVAMARHRGKDSYLWRMAATLEPVVRLPYTIPKKLLGLMGYRYIPRKF